MPEDSQPNATNEPVVPEQSLEQPVSTELQPVSNHVEPNSGSVFHTINRVTGIVLLISAVLFAMISLLAIWDVFGDDTGDIVWRSFSSLATIAFASLVVNIASKLIEQHSKS